MPLYPELCSSCGLNIRRAECPRCPCVYCRSTSHVVKDCPSTDPCEYCESKDHPSKHCQLKVSSRKSSDRRQSYSKAEAAPRLDTQARPWKQKDVPIPQGGATILSERHDDPSWIVLDHDLKEVPSSPEIHFPASLYNECEAFLQEIVDGRLQIDSKHDYVAMITIYGGVTVIANSLIKMVHEEVFWLEGRLINKDSIKEILQYQSHHRTCGQIGGYVDVVLDRRSDSWARFYVGQSSRIIWRIFKEHVQNIVHHSCTSLHYYMLWLGNGNREANFLRLWSLPAWFEWDDYAKICSNLLEGLFCRAFQSHHGCLTPIDENPPSTLGWGLNIISPLHQGPVMFEMQKLKQVGLTTRSPDMQISKWNSFRTKQRNKAVSGAFKKLTSTDYEAMLRSAIGVEAYSALQTEERVCSFTGDLQIHEKVKVVGNPAASITFVLPANFEDISWGIQELPWAIQHSGFNESNVFVLQYDENGTVNGSIHSSIKKRLDASNSKVILLCDMRDAASILPTVEPSTLEIRSYTYRVDYDSRKNQLFLRCRTLPMKTTGLECKHASSICEIIKLAGVVGKVGRLSPYFLQSSSAIGFVIRQRALEKQGAPRMTTETLDPAVKAWLGRKGFDREEDILQLEKLSGTLIYGILMLLQCLPQCPAEWANATVNEKAAKKNIRVHSDSDYVAPGESEKIKRFCRETISLHQLEWNRRRVTARGVEETNAEKLQADKVSKSIHQNRRAKTKAPIKEILPKAIPAQDVQAQDVPVKETSVSVSHSGNHILPDAEEISESTVPESVDQNRKAKSETPAKEITVKTPPDSISYDAFHVLPNAEEVSMSPITKPIHQSRRTKSEASSKETLVKTASVSITNSTTHILPTSEETPNNRAPKSIHQSHRTNTEIPVKDIPTRTPPNSISHSVPRILLNTEEVPRGTVPKPIHQNSHRAKPIGPSGEKQVKNAPFPISRSASHELPTMEETPEREVPTPIHPSRRIFDPEEHSRKGKEGATQRDTASPLLKSDRIVPLVLIESDNNDEVIDDTEQAIKHREISFPRTSLFDGKSCRPEDAEMMVQVGNFCREKGVRGEELPLDQLFQGLDLLHTNILNYDEELRKEENDFTSFDLPRDQTQTASLCSGMISGKRTKFPTTPRSWLTENYRNKLYTHQIPETAAGNNLRQISVWQLRFIIPDWLDAGPDNLVHISIEMCAEHISHPDRWAQAATGQDIGRCLALKVLGTDSQGRPFVYVPKTKGSLNVYRANSFVDMLLHQRTLVQIAQTPRRFVYPRANDLQDHPELIPYKNGGYTPE